MSQDMDSFTDDGYFNVLLAFGIVCDGKELKLRQRFTKANMTKMRL